jgi:hypothetical protein
MGILRITIRKTSSQSVSGAFTTLESTPVCEAYSHALPIRELRQ